MKRKANLHALIQAMSRAEKRYFTLDARKSGRSLSRYLQLFKAINAQEEYNEVPLKKKFGSRLPDDKSRLYEAILRTMRDYRAQRSLTARIKELLLDVDFLYERGLYDQATLRLEEARQIADELEEQPAGLEINREARRLLNTRTVRVDHAELPHLKTDSTEKLSLLAEEFNYLNIHDELIREVQSRRSGGDQKSGVELEKSYYSSLFDRAEPTSIRGRLRFFQARAMYHQLHDNQKGFYENFRKAVSLWDAHPKFKKEEFNRYLNDAFNLLHATFNYSPALSEASVMLDRLSAETPVSTHDQAVLFQRTTTARLFYAINYDARRPADEVLPPIEQKLEQVDLHPVSEMTILFNGAILYFIQGAAENCERWLMKIIELKKNQLRPDITQSSRLLRLLCLIDQEMNEDFMEAILRSEQRYLAKAQNDRIVSFGKWLVRSLRNYTNAPFSERKNILAQLCLELNGQWTKLPLELDELVEKWLEAKRSNTNILALM
jgi:hypothetical protein